jgi:hypothetical protein
MSNKIPRWQQGVRPMAYGEVWDAMTPVERRSAFRWDLGIGFGGTALIFFFGKWMGL